MFAIVRSGGKQYRVAPGDKIVVEKLAGEAGDNIDLTDILLAGEGSELKSVAGLTVGARIVAQAKGEKVTVFKKRRRHNYRRKAGHRQKHTILEILSIGDHTAPKKPVAAPKAEAVPVKAETKPVPSKAEGAATPAPEAKAEKPAAKPVPSKAEGAETKPAKAEAKPAAAKPAKPASKAEGTSTKDAAPVKGADKKAAPKAAAKTPKKK